MSSTRGGLVEDGGLAGNACRRVPVFVNLSKGREPFPVTVEVRMSPAHTVGELKRRVQEEAGVAADKQQLFWRGKELRSDLYDELQLARLDLVAGTSFNGYDLNEEPHYWPEVEMTEQGLRVKRRARGGECKTRAEMGYTDGLSMQQAIAAYRGPGPPHAGGEQERLGSSFSSADPPEVAEVCPESTPPVEEEESYGAVDEVSLEEQLEEVTLEDAQVAKVSHRRMQAALKGRASKYR